MPDVYANIAEADPAVVEGLVDILELRASDPQQREMRNAYFSDIEFPADARVVEVGCGTGAVTRALAAYPGVGPVVGIDRSPTFLSKGRELGGDLANLSFVEGLPNRRRGNRRAAVPPAMTTVAATLPRPTECRRRPARHLRPPRRRSTPWSCVASFLYSSELVDVPRPLWGGQADPPFVATYSAAIASAL